MVGETCDQSNCLKCEKKFLRLKSDDMCQDVARGESQEAKKRKYFMRPQQEIQLASILKDKERKLGSVPQLPHIYVHVVVTNIESEKRITGVE